MNINNDYQKRRVKYHLFL